MVIKFKPKYSALQWKIYLKIALIAFAALVAVVLLRGLLNNRAANWIVSAIQDIFSLDFREAHRIYLTVIRNNIDYLIYATFGIFFLILSRFLLSQFSKYFNEISEGLDALVENKDVKLSPEMDLMEKKLKTIRQTLEQREKEAQSAEQRKNDVVMYLAHDIKTPLTSVIGYLSLLDEAPEMPSEQKAKYINITLEKAYRLERLVDEFFEIARYNFQADALSKEKIDLSFMLSQMIAEFYPLLSAKGKTIELNIAEDFKIFGDADKLARVFNNILKNAIAYSSENSVIKISAEISGDTTLIIFTNDGSIPKEKLAVLFEKFYRLDSARSSGTAGAGLGLAIAKEIVSSHGGSIFAESNDENTVFTVQLPMK